LHYSTIPDVSAHVLIQRIVLIVLVFAFNSDASQRSFGLDSLVSSTAWSSEAAGLGHDLLCVCCKLCVLVFCFLS
jgi:hypothetical protein